MKKRQRKKGARRVVTVGFSRMEGIIEMRGRVVNGKWREDYRRLPDRTAEGPSATEEK